MKTRLLKKIRKEYPIIHDRLCNRYEVISYNRVLVTKTLKESIEIQRELIISHIHKDYAYKYKKRVNIKIKSSKNK